MTILAAKYYPEDKLATVKDLGSSLSGRPGNGSKEPWTAPTNSTYKQHHGQHLQTAPWTVT